MYSVFVHIFSLRYPVSMPFRHRTRDAGKHPREDPIEPGTETRSISAASGERCRRRPEPAHWPGIRWGPASENRSGRGLHDEGNNAILLLFSAGETRNGERGAGFAGILPEGDFDMIVILKAHAEQNKIDALSEQIRQQGVSIHYSQGHTETILGLIGDTTHVDEDWLRASEIVEDVRRVSEPYKLVNRRFHPEDTRITVAGRTLGEGTFSVIAGPCSVETEEQIISVARSVKASGAAFLRGGAFKPRTSPYSFQGLEGEGLRLLKIARKVTGLPIVTEIMSENQLDDFADVDVIQVGARNMQNFRLLKELGHSKKPILLKRGLSSTMEELFMSAEYIMAGGNENVILCERGIRTFEKMIRNNLDISAVPIIKAKSHLPVIIDPSHAAGIAWMVEPLARTAVAAGADGLMIEVHNDPAKALCDGAQSLNPQQFDRLMADIRRRVAFEEKTLEGQ